MTIQFLFQWRHAGNRDYFALRTLVSQIRFTLSHRDLEEMMERRGLRVNVDVPVERNLGTEQRWFTYSTDVEPRCL